MSLEIEVTGGNASPCQLFILLLMKKEEKRRQPPPKSRGQGTWRNAFNATRTIFFRCFNTSALSLPGWQSEINWGRNGMKRLGIHMAVRTYKHWSPQPETSNASKIAATWFEVS
jgi:hypothetical protein